MANTYTQIHLQLVFAVQNRISLIQPSWKDELYKYMATIIQNDGHKLLIINGMPDHIHILIGMRPTQSISDLMKEIKRDSSYWINQKKFMQGKFSWQEGYGAFSYSKAQVPTVINYIKNQQEHHTKKAFREEYMDMLKKYEVAFDEQYVFHDVE
jgi:putative transposase